MKNNSLPAAVLGLVLVCSPSLGFAAEGPKAKIFAKYDTNKNGAIDGNEIVAVRQAFTADPKGEFANYDKNKDGKLDDAEVAEIKPPGAKKGGEKKSGGKKQNDTSKPATK